MVRAAGRSIYREFELAGRTHIPAEQELQIVTPIILRNNGALEGRSSSLAPISRFGARIRRLGAMHPRAVLACRLLAEIVMKSESSEHKLISLVRQALPLSAHAKPSLLTFLRDRTGSRDPAPRLTIVNIFESRDANGPMCQILVEDLGREGECFFAPLTQVSLGHRHPLSGKIKSYQRTSLRMMHRRKSGGSIGERSLRAR